LRRIRCFQIELTDKRVDEANHIDAYAEFLDYIGEGNMGKHPLESVALEIWTILQMLPKHWDGKSAILEMRKRDYQWRQMEWIGFYGEMKAKDLLSEKAETPGRRYGCMEFDIFWKVNWDIKVHPRTQSSAILNDSEAIDSSIKQYGYHGLIILGVDCEYDSESEFKQWHDRLKGGLSVYEEERIYRGAPSRRRKKSADLTSISLVAFDEDTVDRLERFQQGMRNSDGSPRRAKYSIKHELIEEMEFRF
jgi:hypothetical protein